jgi:spermidine synthase
MIGFFLGLGLMCASTLMYEITLTRLLSVTCWYYLALVSVSMAMFGMTAGALAVQLRPALFDRTQVRLRMAQASFVMAISMPIVLMIMFAIPLDISFAAQTVASFLIFCSIIAVPFFFAGIAVCLSLTRASAPIGRVYFADLMGAAAGCFGSVILLNLVDAPSAVMVISALVFLSASAYAHFAAQPRLQRRGYMGAGVLVLLAALNASTIHGIQPIWSKGKLDARTDILYETWNPISRVRVVAPKMEPRFVGPHTPPISSEVIYIDIDNDAATGIYRFQGDLKDVDFLRYEVNSMGARLRAGGSAAIIGVGGGRDVMACALFGFHRIVGIEINSSIVDVTSRRMQGYSGFDKIPNFELHNDEGRSFLTRSHEKFDLIQATVVDTWAATAAGAMALTENSLYSLDGWRIFYDHLKPGGVIAFSRWNHKPDFHETTRLFSLAYATLLSEGVQDPESHLAMIRQEELATLLTSNQPFSAQDLDKIRTTAKELDYQILFLPGEELGMQQLTPVLQARTLAGLAALRSRDYFDLSPPSDSSPYFFSFVRFHAIPGILRIPGVHYEALLPLMYLTGFMLAALILVVLTIVWPARRWTRMQQGSAPAPGGAILYFIGIGLGFMLAEMGMMQQLSIFLGQPIYSLAVVLAGLILAAGLGSLASDRLPISSALKSRAPALLSALVLLAYSLVVLPAIHGAVGGVLWQRIAVSLALVMPCGFIMGFCFPVGMRWASQLGQEGNLPWMWALNGAASVLASFIAICISTEISIRACILTGAACYALGGILLSGKSGSASANASLAGEAKPAPSW